MITNPELTQNKITKDNKIQTPEDIAYEKRKLEGEKAFSEQRKNWKERENKNKAFYNKIAEEHREYNRTFYLNNKGVLSEVITPERAEEIINSKYEIENRYALEKLDTKEFDLSTKSTSKKESSTEAIKGSMPIEPNQINKDTMKESISPQIEQMEQNENPDSIAIGPAAPSIENNTNSKDKQKEINSTPETKELSKEEQVDLELKRIENNNACLKGIIEKFVKCKFDRSDGDGNLAHLEWKIDEGHVITFFDKTFGNKVEKDGKEVIGKYKLDQIVAHEMGHSLIENVSNIDAKNNNKLIYSIPEINTLNKHLRGDKLEEAENETLRTHPEFSFISGLMKDALKSESDTENLALKESAHVQSLLGIYRNPEKLAQAFEKHNTKSEKHKLSSIEEYKKLLEKNIANETLAEKLSYYLMSENKTPLDMLLKRMENSPQKELTEYLKMDDKSFGELTNFISTTMESNDTLENKKSNILSQMENTNPNFKKLYEENEMFFDLFHNNLKDKSPESLLAIRDNKMEEFKKASTDIDKLDDESLYDLFGYDYGESFSSSNFGGSMESANGESGGKGIIEWIVETFNKIISGRA